jgi:hypothetical protein
LLFSSKTLQNWFIARNTKKAIGPSTYPSLLKVKGRAMMPAPIVLLTMMVVVRKKSRLRLRILAFALLA